MKKLILSIAVLTSFNVFSCEDFSGVYLDTNSGDTFSVLQRGCEFISIDAKENNVWDVQLPLDGIVRPSHQAELGLNVSAKMDNRTLVVQYLFPKEQDLNIAFVVNKKANGDLSVVMNASNSAGDQSSDEIIFERQ